ncbi:MAG: fibrillarin-like rRNA/tRNA 2'-O-methyltransferase [Candidatus Pacearchaeota archaeon]|nr:fibrillarin-like rRNA/tRNA 2'-O-methyltransferase [Candidatus Pacearchaeota archaeon]MDE1848508.1 fibrillarin-like rRNA/tRNA 2'-O-methyltransferase [Nanoarchaeota archaeon]
MKHKDWSPENSKWKAALDRGLDIKPKENDNILYLGASSGTTVKQISKLTRGIVFAVENSPEMAIELVKLAEKSKNIAPIFSDARDIEFLKKSIFGKRMNILFQDIPSVDQVEILTKASTLLDSEGKILFSLKTQSISQKPSKETFEKVEKMLGERFRIISKISLEPYHKKHYFFVLRKQAY